MCLPTWIQAEEFGLLQCRKSICDDVFSILVSVSFQQARLHGTRFAVLFILRCQLKYSHAHTHTSAFSFHLENMRYYFKSLFLSLALTHTHTFSLFCLIWTDVSFHKFSDMAVTTTVVNKDISFYDRSTGASSTDAWGNGRAVTSSSPLLLRLQAQVVQATHQL